jgi:hypothetical protein
MPFPAKSPKSLLQTKQLTSVFRHIVPEMSSHRIAPRVAEGSHPLAFVGTEQRRAGPFSGGEARAVRKA